MSKLHNALEMVQGAEINLRKLSEDWPVIRNNAVLVAAEIQLIDAICLLKDFLVDKSPTIKSDAT